jgi:hypothetical protein
MRTTSSPQFRAGVCQPSKSSEPRGIASRPPQRSTPSCGGSCNGPVIVSAGNINEARLLAQEECDCDGCCQYLGCGGVGCAGNATLTEAQKSFVPSAELLKAARRVTRK